MGKASSHNIEDNKSTKYKIKMCGCIADYIRILYSKYGRDEYLKMYKSGNITKLNGEKSSV